METSLGVIELWVEFLLPNLEIEI